MEKSKYLVPKLFLLNVSIIIILFYLFEENKSCLLDFGTKRSNQFIIRCTVQSIFMTGVFYFSTKYSNKEKK